MHQQRVYTGQGLVHQQHVYTISGLFPQAAKLQLPAPTIRKLSSSNRKRFELRNSGTQPETLSP